MCVWQGNKWPKGIGLLEVFGVRLLQHPGAVVLGLASSKIVKRGRSNFPKSGVGRGPASLTYQSIEDEEEAWSLLNYLPLIPRVL